MTTRREVIDERFGFVAAFDTETGAYIRSGIMAGKKMTRIDPFMASFPHLLDIGIMGHCLHGQKGLCVEAGVQCYQSGLTHSQPNMRLEDYRRIIDECEGRVFQVALGGRGDPDLHEDFASILAYTHSKGIVPNLTTSGYGLTRASARLIAQYCGAAAVSWYRSPYTQRAIELLLEAGVKTNIHYVLSNNTLQEAMRLIQDRALPRGINRIIFLLHKPVGLGQSDNVLRFSDPRVAAFFAEFNKPSNADIAGFDSCSVPALMHFAPDLLPMTYDTCEGARYSAYVTPSLQLTPCSFDQNHTWAVDLNSSTIEKAWFNPEFETFRYALRSNCKLCRHRPRCLGGCPITRQIVLCERVQGGVAK